MLVVEDDEGIGHLIGTLLSEIGIASKWVRTGHQALASVADARPNLMILDLGLPGMYGTSVAVTVHRQWPRLPIVVASALEQRVVAEDACNIGAVGFIVKPFDVNDFVHVVRQALSTPAAAAP